MDAAKINGVLITPIAGRWRWNCSLGWPRCCWDNHPCTKIPATISHRSQEQKKTLHPKNPSTTTTSQHRQNSHVWSTQRNSKTRSSCNSACAGSLAGSPDSQRQLNRRICQSVRKKRQYAPRPKSRKKRDSKNCHREPPQTETAHSIATKHERSLRANKKSWTRNATSRLCVVFVYKCPHRSIVNWTIPLECLRAIFVPARAANRQKRDPQA